MANICDTKMRLLLRGQVLINSWTLPDNFIQKLVSLIRRVRQSAIKRFIYKPLGARHFAKISLLRLLNMIVLKRARGISNLTMNDFLGRLHFMISHWSGDLIVRHWWEVSEYHTTYCSKSSD